MRYFAQYHTSTGAITRTYMGDQASEADFDTIEGQAVAELTRPASIRTDYIKDGEVTPRPVSPVKLKKLDQNTIELSGLTVRSRVTINGIAVEHIWPVTEYELELPGVYTFRVQDSPYLDYEGAANV